MEPIENIHCCPGHASRHLCMFIDMVLEMSGVRGRYSCCCEHLVLVCDPHTQALLQCADNLVGLFDRAHVHNPCGSAYEPQGHNFVLQFGQVRAHKDIIHKPEKYRHIGWDVGMAEHELCCMCR